MHAVCITFRSAASPTRVEDPGETDRQLAEALRDGAVSGFVSKTWLSDGPTLGGFYLFRDREDADRYLEGVFAQAITNNRAFSDVRVERYDVNQAMSAITNGLGTSAMRARE